MNEDEENLVTAHIARFDQMSGYEQVSALIDEGHGYYDMDNGFNNDIIGLHVADVDDLYELNNVRTNKSKTTKSEQSDELELDSSDVVAAESDGSNESVPDGNANQNVRQTKPSICEHDSFNVTRKEVNPMQDPDFLASGN